MTEQQRMSRPGWPWVVILLAAFVVVFGSLLVLKHNAFNTRTYDFARFDQAIWNTLHGRFLFSTVLNASILGNHFSPLLAALSPLFLLWDDPRMLLLVQVVCVAATGYLLFRIVRLKHPVLAPWFLAAFLLNPAVHEITLFEFRRIVPAMPFLAFAFYALYTKRRWPMLAGLVAALLYKENVAFVVTMVGLYLWVFERDWKWGVPIALLGVAWLVVVSLWVIPAFSAPKLDSDAYPQLYYFKSLGDSYDEIWASLARDPLLLFGRLFDGERLLAIGRVLLPLGWVLPFLAPGWSAICLPTVVYMMLSDKPAMYRFEQWYLATVLPVLFAAVAVGLSKLPKLWARRATALLMVGTLAGFFLYSPAPLGGAYEASLYEVTDHHRIAEEIVRSVPKGASVATQPRYVPHLAHREHVYHYPWIVIGLENTDYLLLDRHSNPYPFSRNELDAEIDDVLANPAYPIRLEADGIYLFAVRQGAQSGTQGEEGNVNRVVRESIKLVSAEVTVQNDLGLYAEPSRSVAQLHPGDQVRVALYWEALRAPRAERTVSVRIVDGAGGLIAQHDGWPARGTRPTSWWEAGWQVRDVHYLTLPEGTAPGPASLRLLVYDSYSQEVLPFDDGQSMIEIIPVQIGS